MFCGFLPEPDRCCELLFPLRVGFFGFYLTISWSPPAIHMWIWSHSSRAWFHGWYFCPSRSSSLEAPEWLRSDVSGDAVRRHECRFLRGCTDNGMGSECPALQGPLVRKLGTFSVQDLGEVFSHRSFGDDGVCACGGDGKGFPLQLRFFLVYKFV